YDELKQDQQRQDLSTIVAYYGVKWTAPDVYNLKHNVGKTVPINDFLSTSQSTDIAKSFARVGGPIEPGDETVMLEIHIDTTTLSTPLADVAEYSDIRDEEELLFEFGASFVIDSVNYDTSDGTWWIKLSVVSEDVLMDNVQTLLKKCRETEMSLLLGELLLKMGLHSGCRKYLETLFDLYGNEHENVANIEELIAETYEQEEKYDQAILYQMKAFDLYASSHRWQDAARVLIRTASCYYDKKNKVITRQYTEKA
ncbi:unnamed protein product, partial [Didymodactylos carnosus]